MKRILICAAAAIVALASCSKTQVVYNDAPEEIGFKAVTGAMTKAPIPGTTLPTTDKMAVYATKATESNGAYSAYFSDVVFEFDSGVLWKGETPQYWPESGYLKFMAYYPADCGTRSGTAGGDITISSIDVSSQDDILYANWTDPQECASKPDVPMTFKHALAQIQVKAQVKDNNMKGVKITQVTIFEPSQKGTLTIDGSTAEWSGVSAGSTLTMDNDIADTELNTTAISLGDVGSLVVPGDQTKLIVDYEISGLAVEGFEIDLSPAKWEMGKKYIYTLIVGLDEIKIKPVVEDWEDGVKVPVVPENKDIEA